MKVEVVGLAFLPLLAAWVLSSRPGTSRAGRATAAAFDALGSIAPVFLWNSDPFSLFLASCAFAPVAFAAMTFESDADPLCRLHLGASLSIVAVSTRHLIWSVSAILLFALLLRRGRASFAPGLAALAGLGLVAASGGGVIGLILVSVGLSGLWLVVSREILRSSSWGLVTRMAASFILLIAVSSVLLRMAAWFPEEVPFAALHAIALGALALGALGTLAATRITTFLTALSLARAGLVWFAILGGAHGRGPLLLELAASGVSLLLVAAALEGVDTLDEVSSLASVSRRMVLTMGLLSACSFPPFPGFVVIFPLSSAVLDGGYAASLVIACALLLVAGLGCLRLVARAWDCATSRTVDSKVGAAALTLAVAAVGVFGIAPARVIEAAMTAALSIF